MKIYVIYFNNNPQAPVWGCVSTAFWVLAESAQEAIILVNKQEESNYTAEDITVEEICDVAKGSSVFFTETTD